MGNPFFAKHKNARELIILVGEDDTVTVVANGGCPAFPIGANTDGIRKKFWGDWKEAQRFFIPMPPGTSITLTQE